MRTCSRLATAALSGALILGSTVGTVQTVGPSAVAAPAASSSKTPSRSPTRSPSKTPSKTPSKPPSKTPSKTPSKPPPANSGDYSYGECTVKAGVELPGVPWAQTTLGFDRIWPITRGKRADGTRVRVAVIDTGVSPVGPLAHVSYVDPHTVLPYVPAGQTATADCDGHGTGVTGIIAGQPSASSTFAGAAPDVTIIPIRQAYQTSAQDVAQGGGTTSGLAAAIRYAVDMKADVINASLVAPQGSPALQQAVAYAAKNDVLIVAASGNTGTTDNRPGWPAAYSKAFDNVLAVGSINKGFEVSSFSVRRSYLDVVAPGEGVDFPAATTGWDVNQSGTSFATPFVTGTAALVRAAHPAMTAAQVKARIRATADPPPANVPSAEWGYGVVNPYLAVTSVRDDAVPSPSPSPGGVAPAQLPPAAQDRSLQHAALGFGLGLVGLALLAGAGAVLTRRRRGAIAASR